METRCTAPEASVFTITSARPLVSPGTRFDAYEVNAIWVPSGDHCGESEPLLACVPAASVETRCTAPEASVFTNRSLVSLVSPGTIFDAKDPNTIRVPSGDHRGPHVASSLACAPAASVETRWIAPVASVFTNTSSAALVSPGTRFDASEVNTIWVPSGDHRG